MKQVLIAVLLITSVLTEAQQIVDFKVKNEANAKDRTVMLDLMREEIYRIEPIEIKFVVDHFKVSNNYAWFEGTAQLKDGKTIDFGDDFPGDCCRVLSLFQKTNGSWTIAEFMPFCTDVCHLGIANRFPKAPKGIFPLDDVYFVE
jgi:hypothetical protein